MGIETPIGAGGLFPSDDFNRLNFPTNTPQPIKIAVQNGWITLIKQDVEIVKFHQDDLETINTAIILLNGMLKAGIIYGEMENIRDIFKDVKGD